MVVEEFKEEEAGVYRCRVDFRTAQTRNTFINVSLIGEEEEEQAACARTLSCTGDFIKGLAASTGITRNISQSLPD